MAPDKAPGIDGMSAMFFQHYWDIVGPLVTQNVLKILNEGEDMDSINSALITLIPKVDHPKLVSEFRPISLCTVLYKLVSKVIAARFKDVLPYVISQNQSAFLPNRLITDNVLLAFELVHCLKNKKRGRMGYAALKLDMSKAFDRVEWSFLKEIMIKMGFHVNWVTLVLKCVSSAKLSFNLNGSIRGLVVPKRGLRQDDSLLFCQATEDSCQAVNRALDYYHRASGQLLNTEKTVMSFSPSTTSAVKDRFHHVLGMPICSLHEKYLGLPSYAGKDKKELFSNIKDRIWKLMNQWHSKLFSIGGREVLLKAVVQSIPTYAMSCFSLPKKFCAQLESMMANFWWGSNTDNSKIHWKKWKFMCSSKADGGMGFRSFMHFNQALLAKQAWKILDNPNSLLATVLQAHYFKNGDFLSAKKGVLPSLTWQSICDGRDLLLKGLRWKIGSGRNVHCASDPWLPGNTTMTPFTYTGDPSFTVEHYISIHWTWDLRILQTHFGDIDIQRILSIPLSPFPREDKLIWQHSDTRIYLRNQIPIGVKGLRLFGNNSNTKFICRTWVMLRVMISSLTLYCHNDLELEQIVCLMWNIWSEGTKRLMVLSQNLADVLCSYSRFLFGSGHKATSSKQVAAGASSQEHLSTPPSVPTASRAPQTWRSPPAGLYKLNVDAACDQAAGTLGYGALIRDHMGGVVAGFSKPFPGFFSPKEMEAAALFHSLIWAIQHQLPIHLIETDSLLLANAINSMSSTPFVTAFHDLVEDITYLLSYFPRVKVSHVKREANKAAHALSKFALRLDEDILWLGEIPSPIHSVVIEDSLH
uniref:Reverse transcriptase domain-containing protein n=1 Tax=Cannabis sativa TaxID=3483 RepID=A0A803NT94_CANSA